MAISCRFNLLRLEIDSRNTIRLLKILNKFLNYQVYDFNLEFYTEFTILYYYIVYKLQHM